MWANAKDDENERRKAQVLHCLILNATSDPRMKSAEQVPHRLTVHKTLACRWELKTPRWAERRALLPAATLQGKGLRP